MRKLSLALAVTCFIFASCGGNKQETPAPATEAVPAKEECNKQDKEKCCKEMTEEQKKECAEFKAKWDNWANLTDAEKKELIAKKKECFDKKRAEMQECEAKMQTKKAEMEAKLAKWDKMSIDEQKAFFDEMGQCCKAKDGDGSAHKKEGCKSEHKEGCKK